MMKPRAMTPKSLAAMGAAMVAAFWMAACGGGPSAPAGPAHLTEISANTGSSFDPSDAPNTGPANWPSAVPPPIASQPVAQTAPAPARPLLLPARIGLARIEFGKMKPIPADEQDVWEDLAADLAEALGPDFGQFIPVSPLVAEAVAAPYDKSLSHVENVIARVRSGAAHQYLDYVLVYEVDSARQARRRNENGDAGGDASLLRLIPLPGRGIEVEATAGALLLDVDGGEPYATFTGEAAEDAAGRVIGTGGRAARLRGRAETRALAALAEDASATLKSLAQTAPAE